LQMLYLLKKKIESVICLTKQTYKTSNQIIIDCIILKILLMIFK
jgi:hypothetical protein